MLTSIIYKIISFACVCVCVCDDYMLLIHYLSCALLLLLLFLHSSIATWVSSISDDHAAGKHRYTAASFTMAQGHKTLDPFTLCMHDLFEWILISVRLICCYRFIIWAMMMVVVVDTVCVHRSVYDSIVLRLTIDSIEIYRFETIRCHFASIFLSWMINNFAFDAQLAINDMKIIITSWLWLVSLARFLWGDKCLILLK